MYPSEQLLELTKPRQAICLVYPTVPTDFAANADVQDAEIAIGLSLAFPKNNIRQRMNWRVKDPKNASAFVDTERTQAD